MKLGKHVIEIHEQFDRCWRSLHGALISPCVSLGMLVLLRAYPFKMSYCGWQDKSLCISQMSVIQGHQGPLVLHCYHPICGFPKKGKTPPASDLAFEPKYICMHCGKRLNIDL